MNIEILRGVALSLCAATVAGLLSFLGLRRLGGIESGPVKRPSRRRRGETRLDTLTYSVTRYVPMSERSPTPRATCSRDPASPCPPRRSGPSAWRRSRPAPPRADRHAARRRRAGLAAAGARRRRARRAAGVLLARRAEWRDELDRQLPDALDLMAICISAGSSFEGALASVGTRMDGAIAEAFARVAKEAAYSSRSEALLGLADRAQVNSITFFTASLVQAERAGSSLVDIIRMQAQSVRTERRLRVDDMTNKLSTKMLFPMLLLMLPSIIMLMLAPMILQLGQFF
ncbi:MAG: type II secretion system F family protein [Eggerthella lenta]